MAFDERTFRRYGGETKIIRAYNRPLFTFEDTNLPYVFAAEHPEGDRVAVTKGMVKVHKPRIILPISGPQFEDGFEQLEIIPFDIGVFFRCTIPYCNISNRPKVEEVLEYGTLNTILEKYERKLISQGDEETALIKGEFGGSQVSLLVYIAMLATISAPHNAREVLDHSQKRGPIMPDEKISDHDMKRLLGGF